MAVSGVSAGDPDAVGAMPEGGKDELGGHAAGAGNPDHPEIRWILQAADPCQVSSAVTAPVTKKCRYLRLPIVHGILLVM